MRYTPLVPLALVQRDPSEAAVVPSLAAVVVPSSVPSVALVPVVILVQRDPSEAAAVPSSVLVQMEP